jgi:hypothetical protein
VFVAVYIGIAANLVLRARTRWIRPAAVTFCLLVGSLTFYRCAGIGAAFVNDPRYDAEDWMAAHCHRGETVETYGLNAYLPRFPRGATVSRVGPGPKRNPLPHVVELVQPYGALALRQPHFIVVSAFWVRDYLAADASVSGRTVPRVRQSTSADRPARAYFRAFFQGKLPYRMVRQSSYRPGLWPALNEYERLAQTVFIFERTSL